MLLDAHTYDELFNLVPDSLIVVRNRLIVLGNNTFYRTFGYSIEDLRRGLPFLDLIHEDYREAAGKRNKRRASRQDIPDTFRVNCVTKNGAVLHCETSAILEQYQDEDTIFVVVRDISERLELDSELHLLHDQMDATLSALPDLLFVTDKEGVIYDYRAPRPEILYLRPEEFLGKRMGDILPKEPARVFKKAIKEIMESGRSSGLAYALEIDGEDKWFEISGAAQGDISSPEGRIIFLVRDISDRKLVEEHLEIAKEAIEGQQQDLDEKNVTIRQILGHIQNQQASYRGKILQDISEIIDPLISKLRQRLGESAEQEIQELESSLDVLYRRDNDEYHLRFSRLTARESEICGLVRQGMSSKEISEHLVLSAKTVEKHREHIRETLGLTGKRMSLSTYLRLHWVAED